MTEIQIYNAQKKAKMAFTPIDANNVRMYVCGPTVYDFAHIGNARPAIVFDIMFRLLRHVYGENQVTYARNITDVDDKINQRALDENRSIAEVTEQTTAQYHADIDALNVLRPNIEPFATQHIPEMIEMIETLIAGGHAYAAENHVLFSVKSMPEYGKFSRKNLDEMIAGARVDVATYKRDEMDFVLWKPSSDDQPAWPSPWGNGRPGWHIECSAMAKKHLGIEFDIHGGGLDLIFPHHQNEVAQSCCANNTDRMANHWMHNEFLNVEGEKMSKSLGNFLTINDARKQHPAEALRLMMLMTHYRKTINWSKDSAKEAVAMLGKWHEKTANIGEVSSADIPANFIDAIADDLNTPFAISLLHKMAGTPLKAAAQFIGLLYETQADFISFKPAGIKINAAYIEALIEQRNTAKTNKDWPLADKIRDDLMAKSVVIKDSTNGTSWEYKK
ncbi:MAG: cysteine--tRNA ligase [Rhizobiales bacterium]|nr:cysteine--tRNA ligase [Hyphomicrobiales bacterium]NRB13052.1 cysteine--tRNA ligase [Hyphomicrobiales bacterium]